MKKKSIVKIIYYIICGLIFFYLVAPIVLVFPVSFTDASYLQMPPEKMSFRWYKAFFNDPKWLEAALLSLKIAIMTTIISLILGVSAATSLNRSNFKGKQILTAFVISPMIVPIIVFAIGIYNIFGGWKLVGNPLGIAIAHSVLAIPYVFINTSAAYQVINPRLEQAAQSLGANPLVAFFKVTFPLIKPGIIAGGLFAFVVSFDELIISMFLGGVYAKTLPLKLWDGLKVEMTPIIASVSSMIILSYILIYYIATNMEKRIKKNPKVE